MTRFDCIIVGTGPAGLEAAITLKIRNKNFAIFGKEISRKVSKAHVIDNYLGMPDISGEELYNAFDEHLRQMNIRLCDEQITTIYPMGDYFSFLTKNNEMYEADSVILATGVSFGKPYPGEEKFLGRGVSYCATCDASLYKGKTVAVIAGALEEEKEAVFLQRIVDKLYYIPLYKDPVSTMFAENAEVISDLPLRIEGEEYAGELVLQNRTLSVDGIFILRDSITPDKLLPGLHMEGNHIAVNRRMETNLPGCFACGDITGTPYQYIKAAGEGNVAALSAAAYLDERSRVKR